jgi:hypothetical protein
MTTHGFRRNQAGSWVTPRKEEVEEDDEEGGVKKRAEMGGSLVARGGKRLCV